MTEKKCPHCAMAIPKDAKICPYCRKKLSSATGAKIGLFLLILIAFSYIAGSLKTSNDHKASPTYTNEQKKAAKELQELLMQAGLVKEYKGEGKLQVVYVDRNLWNITAYEKKKEILKNLSKTNEIRGHTPWVEIRDHLSGEVYGALKPPLTFEIYK